MQHDPKRTFNPIPEPPQPSEADTVMAVQPEVLAAMMDDPNAPVKLASPAPEDALVIPEIGIKPTSASQPAVTAQPPTPTAAPVSVQAQPIAPIQQMPIQTTPPQPVQPAVVPTAPLTPNTLIALTAQQPVSTPVQQPSRPVAVPTQPIQTTVPVVSAPPVATPTTAMPSVPAPASAPVLNIIPAAAPITAQSATPEIVAPATVSAAPAPQPTSTAVPPIAAPQPIAPAPPVVVPPRSAPKKPGGRLTLQPIDHAPLQPVATMAATETMTEQLSAPTQPYNPLATKKAPAGPKIVSMKKVTSTKNYLTAVVLSGFFGIIGIDRIYLGYPMTGVLKAGLLIAAFVLKYAAKQWHYMPIVCAIFLGLWALWVVTDFVRIFSTTFRSADNMKLGMGKYSFLYAVAVAILVIVFWGGVAGAIFTVGKPYLATLDINIDHIVTQVKSFKKM